MATTGEKFLCRGCKGATIAKDYLCQTCINAYPAEQRWRAALPQQSCVECSADMQGSGSQLCYRCHYTTECLQPEDDLDDVDEPLVPHGSVEDAEIGVRGSS